METKRILKILTISCLLVFFASCSKQITVEQIAAFDQAQDDYYRTHYEVSETKTRDILKKNKNFYQARLLLAKNLYMQEKYRKSLKELEKLCKKYNIYPEAEKWYIRSLLQTGNSEQAISEIKMVLSYDPENLDFLTLAAGYYAGEKDLKSRIEMLSQIPLQSDKIARAHLELARIYYSYLDYDKALEQIDRCLRYLDDGHLLKKPVLELRQTIIEKQENSK
ncbi:MAG: hypothetical protein JW874_16650 [Spirochaetales bacterium]|nr:hypothetical protein [Spirochaetales bacterium]